MSLVFNDDYFMDEVIDGFLTESRMKRLWASDMKDLSVLREACDKCGVKYTLAGGSLLGAIRNGGHIPWDDDLDIEMRRTDYHKACDNGLLQMIPEPYWVSDYKYYGNGYQLVKLVNSHSYNLGEEERAEKYGCEFANAIDLFLLDSIPENESDREFFFKVIEICEIIRADQEMDPDEFPDNYRMRKEQVKKLFGYEIETDEKETIDSIILRYLDEFFLRYDENESKELALLYFYVTENKYKYPQMLYDRYLEMDYENGSVWVPAGYDGILRRNFGDYMYPVIGTAFHDYPCYTYHIRKLKESGVEYRAYHIDAEFYNNAFSISRDGFGGNKAVFLCTHAENWAGLDRLYSIIAEEGWDVKVVVVPYQFRDHNGVPSGELITDFVDIPDSINVVSYDEYSFEDERPDLVIYQWPYDEYNGAIDIPDDYYISNIRQYAGKLVLIPPFLLRDINTGDICSRYGLGTWVKTPGFMLADMIVAQSENMKDVMKEIVSVFSAEEGVSDIGRSVADRIIDTGNPLSDIPELKDYSWIPDSFADRIKKSDGTYKKLLVFYLSASVVYEHGMEALIKAEKDLETICAYGDIAVWWVLDRHMEEIVFMDGELSAYYDTLLDDFGSRSGVIIDPDPDFERLADTCDGFFGDGCMLMNEVRMRKKPVFWETPGEYLKQTSQDTGIIWDDATEIAVEGVWSVDGFLEEFLRYEKAYKDCHIAEAIWGRIN